MLTPPGAMEPLASMRCVGWCSRARNGVPCARHRSGRPRPRTARTVTEHRSGTRRGPGSVRRSSWLRAGSGRPPGRTPPGRLSAQPEFSPVALRHRDAPKGVFFVRWLPTERGPDRALDVADVGLQRGLLDIVEPQPVIDRLVPRRLSSRALPLRDLDPHPVWIRSASLGSLVDSASRISLPVIGSIPAYISTWYEFPRLRMCPRSRPRPARLAMSSDHSR